MAAARINPDANANHWLYNYIPQKRADFQIWQIWKSVPWALFGNDDDGIFGEKRSSGQKWIRKWEGNPDINNFNPGVISVKRFLQWQLRNPLHNFTNYVMGLAGQPNIARQQILLATTQGISGTKTLNAPNTFPMEANSGVYVGLHGERPFISYRLNLFEVTRIEGYLGWRPNRGGFGIALRAKSIFDPLPGAVVMDF